MSGGHRRLPIHCTKCDRAVTVEYEPEVMIDVSPPTTWTCPYFGCAGQNLLMGARHIISILPGHARP